MVEKPACDHSFAVLLARYLDVCVKADSLCWERKKLEMVCKQMMSSTWINTFRTKTYTSTCLKGAKAVGYYSTEDATINTEAMLQQEALVLRLRTMCIEQQSPALFQRELEKLRCEQYVHKVVEQYENTSQVANSPYFYGANLNVILVSFSELPDEFRKIRDNIRTLLDTLFYFLRQPENQPYSASIINWITVLMETLFKCTAPEDHMYLLFQFLRCPDTFGKWASKFIHSFVHISSDLFPAVNLYLILLDELFIPLRNRSLFVHDFQTESEEPFSVVGLDGEERSSFSEIDESDLLCCFDRFSADPVFNAIFLLIDCSNLNPLYLRYLLDFELVYLRIFQKGLKTYDCCRFETFCKRLASSVSGSLRCLYGFMCQRLEGKVSEEDVNTFFSGFKNLRLFAIQMLISLKTNCLWEFVGDIPMQGSNDDLWHILLLFVKGSDADLESLQVTTIQHCMDQTDQTAFGAFLSDLNAAGRTFAMRALCNLSGYASDVALLSHLLSLIVYGLYEFIPANGSTLVSGKGLLEYVLSSHPRLLHRFIELCNERDLLFEFHWRLAIRITDSFVHDVESDEENGRLVTFCDYECSNMEAFSSFVNFMLYVSDATMLNDHGGMRLFEQVTKTCVKRPLVMCLQRILKILNIDAINDYPTLVNCIQHITSIGQSTWFPFRASGDVKADEIERINAMICTYTGRISFSSEVLIIIVSVSVRRGRVNDVFRWRFVSSGLLISGETADSGVYTVSQGPEAVDIFAEASNIISVCKETYFLTCDLISQGMFQAISASEDWFQGNVKKKGDSGSPCLTPASTDTSPVLPVPVRILIRLPVYMSLIIFRVDSGTLISSSVRKRA
ncbi:unnamed protein product [Soboliphyme baturini]|uniref:Uncharacterized protein n=1 Tax=Soboliphyme baturini TaxID=241478 RepID=A0A3P8E4S4_9BILA|nr:unnamed protein product [Soboliphyme baturini]